MEIIIFVVSLSVCCVSLTGFVVPSAALALGRAVVAVLSPCPTDQQTWATRSLLKTALPVVHLLLVPAARHPWLHKHLVEVVWSTTFGLLRGQSHKQSHWSSRMRRRGKAACRSWSEELNPASSSGGSCFMRVQQTTWVPAASQTKQKDVVSALKTRWAVMRK